MQLLDQFIPNYGFIVKFSSSIQQSILSYKQKQQINFFNRNTNTIYKPTIQLHFNDYILDSGSLSQQTGSNIYVAMNNIKPKYNINSVQKIRVSVIPQYHIKTFSSQFGYSDTKYVTSASYGLIDMHTKQMIIDFDSQYTNISCDSTIGNYF